MPRQAKPRCALTAALLVATTTCAGSPSESVGTAEQPWCQGYVTHHVVVQNAIVFFVAPSLLAMATEGWGPQTLSLDIARGFQPQVSYQETPSIASVKGKITKSIQAAIGFSLTESIDLVASTSVLVPTGAYYRLEAYPEYQAVDWEVSVDTCGPMPGGHVTGGSVYRPVGVYFRVMVFIGGAWNALSPASPSEAPLPPSLGGPAPGGGTLPHAGDGGPAPGEGILPHAGNGGNAGEGVNTGHEDAGNPGDAGNRGDAGDASPVGDSGPGADRDGSQEGCL